MLSKKHKRKRNQKWELKY